MAYVRNEFLFGQKKGFGEFTVGHLVSVRSLQNQCFQFSVLLGNGALFTGLPAHAIAFKQEAPKRPLNESQMWDSISSSIDIIQLELLLYMPATIKLFSGELVKGEYLFTIDAVGTNKAAYTVVEKKIRKTEPKTRTQIIKSTIPEETYEKVFTNIENTLTMIHNDVFERKALSKECWFFGKPCSMYGLCWNGDVSMLYKKEKV